uniref:Uncharacterized protein n=1 Tax=Rhizophora mucronata TaxID=61149 RepID=A0A2P2PQN0_RHIMU
MFISFWLLHVGNSESRFILDLTSVLFYSLILLPLVYIKNFRSTFAYFNIPFLHLVVHHLHITVKFALLSCGLGFLISALPP